MADFQTSFIPKKTFDVGAAPARRSNSSLSGLIFFVSVIIFLISGAGAVGTFLYGRYLLSAIDSKKQSLERAKAAFEPETIRQLSRLDTKLRISKELLDKHVAPSAIFDLLEQSTLETVRFSGMNYETAADGIHLKMQGEAVSFASIALESDEFSKNRSIKEPVFSNFQLTDKGNVTFTVDAIVDPSLVLYRERIASGGSAMFEVTPSPDEGRVAGAATTTTVSAVPKAPVAPQTPMVLKAL